jgi:hypothetical protein
LASLSIFFSQTALFTPTFSLMKSARRLSYESKRTTLELNRSSSRDTSQDSIFRASNHHKFTDWSNRFIEALKDPKTWLFFLHAWSQEMANGITNQYSLIINSFGFTILQTTLLGCVTGIVSFFSLISAATALYYTKVSQVSSIWKTELSS